MDPVPQRSEGANSPNVSNVTGPITIIYGRGMGDPPLEMLLFPVSTSTRMHFRARRVPFVGYESELIKLDQFLSFPERFKWSIVVGEARAGKSRLALELCLRHQEEWSVGFLLDKQAFDGWQEWQPKKPTLIVVDYASLRDAALQTIVTTLAIRQSVLAHPVRVLLLERSARGDWWRHFVGTGSTRLLVESVGSGEPLELGSLSDDSLWHSITTILEQSGMNRRPEREETIAALVKLDPLRRPLFAALAADSLVAGRDIRSWDQAALLRDVLEREDERFWKPAGVTEADRNLLCFATVVGGMLLEDLRIPYIGESGYFPSVDSRDEKRFNAERYQSLTGVEATHALAPLKPDAVGEFFALEQLKPRDDADASRTLTMLLMAWMAGPTRIFDFVSRVFQDFPNHPATHWLEYPLSNARIETMLQLIPKSTETHEAGEPTEAEPDESKDVGELLFGVVPAKANLIRMLCSQDRVELAATHFDELGQLARQFPVHDYLESIVYSTAPLLFLAYSQRGDDRAARNVFGNIVERWKEQGRERETFELIIRAALLTAENWVHEGRFIPVREMSRELVRIMTNESCEASVYGVFAMAMRGVISACLDIPQCAQAAELFAIIVDLKDKANDNVQFALHSGLAGFALLLARSEDFDYSPEQKADMTANFGYVRDAFDTPGFAEAASADMGSEGAADVMNGFAGVRTAFEAMGHDENDETSL